MTPTPQQKEAAEKAVTEMDNDWSNATEVIALLLAEREAKSAYEGAMAVKEKAEDHIKLLFQSDWLRNPRNDFERGAFNVLNVLQSAADSYKPKT